MVSISKSSQFSLFSTMTFLVYNLLACATFITSIPDSTISGEGFKEAQVLQKWKASLDNESQSLLSSWNGDTPCKWVGVDCYQAGGIANLSLQNAGLRGTIHSLNFSSLTSVTIHSMEPFLHKLVTFAGSPSLTCLTMIFQETFHLK